MSNHNELGKTGELLAEKFLAERGFVILDRNWRHGRYEIDIIASLGDTLHFVEVKTRSSDTFGLPEESVSEAKMKRLSSAANVYLQINQGWKWIQFDIVSVTTIKGGDPEYCFLQDVWVGAGNIKI
jgi:putative endonuclease